MTDKKVHAGRFSVTRREQDFDLRNKDASPNTDYNIIITMEDDSTGRNFLEITLSGAEFLNAITSMHGRPCEFAFNEKNLALVGKVRQTMSCRIRERKIGVVVPHKYADEGWTHWSGYGNHHNARNENGKIYYECLLVRYVDKTDDSEFPDEAVDLPWNDKKRRK